MTAGGLFWGVVHRALDHIIPVRPQPVYIPNRHHIPPIRVPADRRTDTGFVNYLRRCETQP